MKKYISLLIISIISLSLNLHAAEQSKIKSFYPEISPVEKKRIYPPHRTLLGIKIAWDGNSLYNKFIVYNANRGLEARDNLTGFSMGTVHNLTVLRKLRFSFYIGEDMYRVLNFVKRLFGVPIIHY